jgi:hypothetical protein
MSTSVFVPLRLKRLGKSTVDADQREPSPALLRALGLALYWQQQLDQDIYPSLKALAQAEGLHLSTAGRILQLALMAPDLIECCLAGQQPRGLHLLWLQRHRLPNDWSAQRALFDSFQSGGDDAKAG